MALITCRECQKQVSSEAKKCPNCGAKVTPHKLPRKSISGTSVLKGILAGMALLIVLSIIGQYRESQKSPEQLQQEAVAREVNKKRLVAIEQEKTMKTQREDRAAAVAAAVRKASRNPENIIWEKILTNEEANVVCITARLENGFGGMTRENITAANGVFNNKNKDWNKYCAKAKLYDVTRIASKMQVYMD